jgi:pyruvate/2-oxoglutarate/acetoin dehydrogenase E1 component
MAKMRVRQAVMTAIADEMRADSTVIVMGEDVGAAGGVFKATEGLFEEFGPLRVRDTPISEMGFMGAAVGASAMGLRPVVEIMFMEFLGVALDQLVTEAAKFRYLSRGAVTCPMVVRTTIGTGLGFGSQHSQTLENWVSATPGLKVVTVSDAQSAYGLTRAAIQDPDPVIVLEPRVLYADRDEVVTGDAGIITIGEARTMRTGTQATVVTMGQQVGATLRAVEQAGLDVDVIDLSTLVPWDKRTVIESARRTGRIITVEEAPASGGWGSEIIATVMAEAYSDIKAPPLRVTCPDVPVPYGKHLEAKFTPNDAEIAHMLGEYLKTNAIPDPWWVREGIVQ